jgi:hypothetical protein
MAVNPGFTTNTGGGTGGGTAAASPGLLSNEYEAITASAGNWAIGDILTRVQSITAATGAIATTWQKPDGTALATVPAIGTDVKDLSQQTLAAVKAGSSSVAGGLTKIIYNTVGGLTPSVGYYDGTNLYSRLNKTSPVTIGTATGNAIANSIEPARPFSLGVDSFPIAHASSSLATFTQPPVGSSVSVTATLISGAGSEAQFTVNSFVFVASSNGSQVAGCYAIRSNAWPTLSLELQNPALNELGASQTTIAPGGTVSSMGMIALSRLTPPVNATSALLSVARPSTAIVSAIAGANSTTPATLQQSQKDQAQINYPYVAINFKPSSLGWDAGPKQWVEDSAELNADELSVWLYAYADEGRSVHATIRWMGGT